MAFSRLPSGRFLNLLFDDGSDFNGNDASFGGNEEPAPFNEEIAESLVYEGAGVVSLEETYRFRDKDLSNVSLVKSHQVVNGAAFFSAKSRGRRRLEDMSPNQVASLVWLKTFLEYFKKEGGYKLPVIVDGFDSGQSYINNFTKAVITNSQKAYNTAKTFGESVDTGDTPDISIAQLFQSAINLLLLTFDTLGEGDRRYGQSAAISEYIREFVKVYGLPPMGLLHAVATVDPDPSYTPILGGGSFLRYDEWAPGVIVSYTKLYAALKKAKFDLDRVPLADPKNFKRVCTQMGVSIVNGGRWEKPSNVMPSRIANHFQYLFHPKWFLQTPLIPAGRTTRGKASKLFWNTDNPYTLYIEVLKENERNDPFEFNADDAELWMRKGGVFQGRFQTRSKIFNQPQFLIFELGHDPGLNQIPTGLSNLLPGNYGTVTINEVSWKSRIELDTNGAWFLS